jgi:hypothetical protein
MAEVASNCLRRRSDAIRRKVSKPSMPPSMAPGQFLDASFHKSLPNRTAAPGRGESIKHRVKRSKVLESC